MSSETFAYKGISAGKYVEGTIEALSQDEANFKLKEQKIIITSITKSKKKAADIVKVKPDTFELDDYGENDGTYKFVKKVCKQCWREHKDLSTDTNKVIEAVWGYGHHDVVIR